MKNKWWVSFFLTLFVLANGFGQQNDPVNRIVKALEDVAQALKEEGITSEGRLVALTLDFAKMIKDDDFKKLSFHLSGELTLIERQGSINVNDKGVAAFNDDGVRVTKEIQRNNEGKFVEFADPSREKLSIKLQGLDENPASFVWDPQTDKYYFRPAGNTSINGPSPYLMFYLRGRDPASWGGMTTERQRSSGSSQGGMTGQQGSQSIVNGNSTVNRHSRSLMGSGMLNRNVIVSYIVSKRTAMNRQQIEALVTTYTREADAEGINVDIAIAQMLHWTDFLRNRERVATHNYGGLSRTDGWNGSFPHLMRDGMTEGVRAHIQHLKGYAGVPLNRREIVDPRYRLAFERGSHGMRFETLYRYWSADPHYGQNIENILDELYRFSGITRR